MLYPELHLGSECGVLVNTGTTAQGSATKPCLHTRQLSVPLHYLLLTTAF